MAERTRKGRGMTNTLYAGLMAGKDRNRPAIIPGWGEPITYGMLDSQSAGLAARLIALGLEPGDRLAVQVEKSAMALILYLAALRAGVVYLPLNTAYTAAELAYFLGDASPRLFVVDPSSRAEVEAIAAPAGIAVATLSADGAHGSLLDGVGEAPADFADVPRRPDDLAAILYTSGTTGRSKGAMLTHANLLSNARTLAEAWCFEAADELLHALPIYHTHGLFVATNVSLVAGAAMRLLPRFDMDAIFRGLETATVMMGVPTFYTRLLADPRLNAASTRGMRLFISGSAPLLVETHTAWEERSGHRILERYGMTETNMNSSNPYDGDRRAGTVGPALPGVSIRIVDPETRQPLPTGDIGMIEVRGPNVFAGYWRMPEKTAAELKPDGFFVTGDLGRIDADGYLEIVGRGKDLIISGGLNIYPKEIETEIDGIDGVIESAVIGVPHLDFGEAVTAIVVKESESELDQSRLLSILSQRLARFKLPKNVVFLAEIPRNAMGKVNKSELRSRYGR